MATWDDTSFEPPLEPLLTEKEETVLTLLGWPDHSSGVTIEAIAERFGHSREMILEIAHEARQKVDSLLDKGWPVEQEPARTTVHANKTNDG